MRDFSAKLYKSKQWQATSKSYLSSVGGLCEVCLKQGIYRPAEIVHHKEFVQPWNIDNPELTLAWSNLQAVCRECHGKIHSSDEKRKSKRRYTIDDRGVVTVR